MMTRGGRITQASLDGLLQAVPLAEYIGQTVSLRRQSGRWVGLCPFHSESSPSFYVFDDHYHCFGCGAHGKAIDFEMHRSGASFPEAAQNLAMRYGVTLESHGREASAAVEERYRKRLTLTSVLEEVSAFYQRCLAHSTGARALDYLLAQRGFTPDTLSTFGLGYAPPQNTLETLSKRKLWSTNLLVELGLLRPSNSGGPQRRYDLMRDRVIVPIHDERGSLVGFGGRELPGGPAPEDDRALKPRGPKYLNSPESELFAKSSLLFNFHRARKEMVRKKSVLVVEGYMDVIKLVQAGFENVVGVLGTALTAEHIKMLARATEHVILCFDGDEAGRKAMMRSFEKAWPLQLVRLSAVQIPAPAKDPDEFVSLHGAEAMTRLLQEARPLLQTVVQTVTAGLPYREERMLAVRNQVLPCIATCPQEAARAAALRDIAEELGLPSHRPLETFVRGLQTRAKASGGEQAKAADGPQTPLVQGATASLRPQGHGHTTTETHPDHEHRGEPELPPGGAQALASELKLASASELRFLLLLMHATWDDVPETLADIVSGRPGRDVTATLITLRTMQTVLSPQALGAVDALIRRMYPGPMPSLAIAEGEGLTGKALASVLVAIESQDVPTLERFGLAPRRLARTDPTTGRFHADQSLLSADNLAFVKFLDRDAALAKMQSTIASQIAKILVGFEVMYLDRELALWSLTEQGRGHGSHDQTNRYRRVLEERARRLMQRSETTSGSGH